MLPYLGQSPVLPEHLQVRLLHYRVLHIHEGLQNGKMETSSASGKLHTHDNPSKNSLTLTLRPLTLQVPAYLLQHLARRHLLTPPEGRRRLRRPEELLRNDP